MFLPGTFASPVAMLHVLRGGHMLKAQRDMVITELTSIIIWVKKRFPFSLRNLSIALTRFPPKGLNSQTRNNNQQMDIHEKYNSEALHLRALLKVTLYLKYCHIPKLTVTAFQWKA